MRESAWPIRRLGTVVTEGGGLLQTGPFGSQLHAYEYTDNGIPVVMPQDIPDGVIDVTSVARVAEQTAQGLVRHRLQAGDVVFSRRGDLSRCALVEASQTGWLCGTGCLLLRPGRSPMSGAFVSRIYRHHAIQSRIAGVAVGTTMANLNTGILARLEIPSPPLPEQRQIAAVLDTIDDAIRKTEQIIAKLKLVKQGLLRDLLTRGIDDNGELRDPERNPEQFKDSPLGRIPREWSAEPIASLLAAVDPPMRSGPFGSALLKSELVPAGIPLLGIDNVHAERFEATYARFVTPKKAKELARYAVRPADVMITIMGTVGRCCVVPHDIGSALSTKHVWTLTFDAARYAPDLACVQINQAPWVLRHFARDEQGGIMSAIRSETLRTTLLPVPPPSEMQVITDVLLELNSRIAAEADLVEKRKLQKAGLMEDLLTGRVRVTNLLEGAG